MKPFKPLVVSLIGALLYIFGLPICTRAGIYIFNIFNVFTGGLPLLFGGFMQCILVSYFYGMNQIRGLQNFENSDSRGNGIRMGSLGLE